MPTVTHFTTTHSFTKIVSPDCADIVCVFDAHSWLPSIMSTALTALVTWMITIYTIRGGEMRRRMRYSKLVREMYSICYFATERNKWGIQYTAPNGDALERASYLTVRPQLISQFEADAVKLGHEKFAEFEDLAALREAAVPVLESMTATIRNWTDVPEVQFEQEMSSAVGTLHDIIKRIPPAPYSGIPGDYAGYSDGSRLGRLLAIWQSYWHPKVVPPAPDR